MSLGSISTGSCMSKHARLLWIRIVYQCSHTSGYRLTNLIDFGIHVFFSCLYKTALYWASWVPSWSLSSLKSMHCTIRSKRPSTWASLKLTLWITTFHSGASETSGAFWAWGNLRNHGLQNLRHIPTLSLLVNRVQGNAKWSGAGFMSLMRMAWAE